jgi:hypothetical protein
MHEGEVHREEDAQRWKREGAPRYKAVKATVTG